MSVHRNFSLERRRTLRDCCEFFKLNYNALYKKLLAVEKQWTLLNGMMPSVTVGRIIYSLMRENKIKRIGLNELADFLGVSDAVFKQTKQEFRDAVISA